MSGIKNYKTTTNSMKLHWNKEGKLHDSEIIIKQNEKVDKLKVCLTHLYIG